MERRGFLAGAVAAIPAFIVPGKLVEPEGVWFGDLGRGVVGRFATEDDAIMAVYLARRDRVAEDKE